MNHNTLTMRMHNTNSEYERRSRIFGVCAIALALVCIPSFANAEEVLGSGLTSGVQATFCASLDRVSAKVSDGMNDKVTRYSAKAQLQQEKLTTLLRDREVLRTSERSKWDTKEETVFTALALRASTPEEKLAVEAFKSAVLAAVSERRRSVDVAHRNFQTDIKKLILARQTAVDEAIAMFRQVHEDAQLDAQRDCRKGLSPLVARAEYLRSLKIAKIAFQTRLTEALQKDKEIPSLIQKRTNAVSSASEVFRNSILSAQRELKLHISDQ